MPFKAEREQMKQPSITIRLKRKEIEALKQIAKNHSATVNTICAQLLREYIKRYEFDVIVSEREKP